MFTELRQEWGAFSVANAEGAYLFDAEGRQWIDFSLGSGCMILGHSSKISDAIALQLGRNFGPTPSSKNQMARDFARQILQFFPPDHDIRFLTTGSEAVAHAIRLARQKTGRSEIVKLSMAYHGNLDDGLSPEKAEGISSAVKTHIFQWDQLDPLEALLKKETISAVLVEPICRVVEVNHELLGELRMLADKYGTMLIFDEVVTGWRNQLGPMISDVDERSITCLGKTIGGGLPLAAVVSEKGNIARFGSASDQVYIGGTHRANPLALAAGSAALTELSEQNYVDLLKRCQSFFSQLAVALGERGNQLVTAGTMFKTVMSKEAGHSWQGIVETNKGRDALLDLALFKNGIYVNPGKRHFVSFAHGENTLSEALPLFLRAISRFSVD